MPEILTPDEFGQRFGIAPPKATIAPQVLTPDEWKNRFGLDPEAQMREESAQRLRTKSIQQQVPGPVAMEGGERFAEAELPMGLQFDIGRSRTAADELAKIRARFPNVEVATAEDPATGTPMYALKMPGEQEYKFLKVDDVMSVGDAARFAGNLLTLETLGSIVGAIATKGRSLIGRVTGQVTGGALGRALDIGTEAARGYESRSVADVFEDALIAGGAAGVGEAAFAPFRRAGRGLTGGGFIQLTPEQIQAEAQARAAGTRLMPGDVSPAMRRAQNQAAAVSSRMQGALDDRGAALLADLKKLRAAIGDPASLNDKTLQEYLVRVSDNLRGIIQNPNIPLETAGEALKEGRSLYVKGTKAKLKALYDKALLLGQGATYDGAAIQAAAKDIRKGVRGKAKAGADEGAQLQAELDEEFGALPLTEKRDAGIQLNAQDSELNGLVGDILKLDPQIAAFEGNSAFEQLKALRTRAFDLKNARIYGTETNINRQAGQLYDVITQVMYEPLGGSPEFVAAAKEAAMTNFKHERVLEVADMARIARETNPALLARTMANPIKGPSLRLMADTMPAEQWQKFKNGFVTDLLSEPEKITNRLSAWRHDPQALRLLLDEQSEASIRKFALDHERLLSDPVLKVLKNDVNIMRRGRQLIESEGADRLAELVKNSGGKNSTGARGLKWGIIDHIIESARITSKAGKEVLSVSRAEEAIKKLESSGTLGAILQPTEITQLKNRATLYAVLRSSADPGAGIQAAEQVSQATNVLNPTAWLRGVQGLAKNATIARLFTNPATSQFLTGTGRQQADFTTLRALSGVMAALAVDYEKDAGAR